MTLTVCWYFLFWTSFVVSAVLALISTRSCSPPGCSLHEQRIQQPSQFQPMLRTVATTRFSFVQPCLSQGKGYGAHFASLIATPSTLRCSRTYTRLLASSTNLEFGKSESGVNYNATVLIGRKDSLQDFLQGDKLSKFLQNDNLQPLAQPISKSMMDSMDDKKGGSAGTFLLRSSPSFGMRKSRDDDEKAYKFSIGGLPSKSISRNNHPMSVHTLTKKVKTLCPSKGDTRLIVLVPDDNNNVTMSVGPLASAIAKAFPEFSMKTTSASRKKKKSVLSTVKQVNGSYNKDDSDDASSSSKRNIHVVFVRPQDGSIIEDDVSIGAARAVSSGVRLATRLVDSHPELLTTTKFAKEVQAIAQEFPNQIKMTQVIGDDLRPYGGLYAVGKAAACPPRLIILEYTPSNDNDPGTPDETVALVGKGIVYDTGGLSLKTKTGMVGMKGDMGGAAGMLGGFYSAVQLGVSKKLYCILCLAENAIGPDAFRNDDILTMYSGKTVEVNNCDAEGRLVLADGVAHATRHFENLSLVVDMATLTGAQLVATGKKHAGLLANTPELERRAMEAATQSGDLCFPMLYAPDMLMSEFDSKVADMRNSVKDRSNAQSSCAGHFIEAHLEEEYDGGWLHIDMAGPSSSEQRGTGFGVGLVLSLLEAPGF